jgi:hypothetical protein
MTLESTLRCEHVQTAGAARRNLAAAPPPVAAQRIRRRTLGALAEVTSVEQVEVGVSDVLREAIDVRCVALLTTAAACAALDAGAAEPRALADGRAGRGAVGDAVVEEEVMCDVALDASRRERHVTRAVNSGKQAQDIGCTWFRRLRCRHRGIQTRMRDQAVLECGLMTTIGVSD